MNGKKKTNDYGTGIPLHAMEALRECCSRRYKNSLRARKASWSFKRGRSGKRKNDNQRRGIQTGCPAAYCSQDIVDGNDKSEHVPYLEDSVRIIISWSQCRDSTPGPLGPEDSAENSADAFEHIWCCLFQAWLLSKHLHSNAPIRSSRGLGQRLGRKPVKLQNKGALTLLY